MAGVCNECERMGDETENQLSDDEEEIEGHANRKRAIEFFWRVRVADAMVVGVVVIVMFVCWMNKD